MKIIDGHVKKMYFFLLALLAAGLLSACGQGSDVLDVPEEVPDAVETTDIGDDRNEEHTVSGRDGEAESEAENGEEAESSAEADELREKFGVHCIPEQTFEVELSEYNGTVWFVPYAPSEGGDFHMQLLQEDKVLTEIEAYVPQMLAGEAFGSLDAVSFYDVNYDGNTDIVLIETYGNTRFAAVYYGFAPEKDDQGFFYLQEQLSEGLTEQVEDLSVSGIREYLSGGKKNGEFSGYQEAYETVGKMCDLESKGEAEYGLLYFDEDDVPELAAGITGYQVSLYSFRDGYIYNLMDHWPYGAMGNAGYEYCPRQNSLRNYNTDYAGAVCYTAYMTMNSSFSMETVAVVETYNFDDVNGNGIPDEDEMESLGKYGVSYIDGREATDEECAALNKGEYEWIEGTLSLKELLAELKR